MMRRPVRSPIQPKNPIGGINDIFVLVRQLISIRDELLQALDRARQNERKEINIKQGPPGPRGFPGSTPSDRELRELIKSLIPKPLKGDKGNPGPSPSIHEIADLVLKLLPQGKGIVNEDAIVQKTLASLKAGGLDINDIRNLEPRLRNLGSKIALGGVVKGGGGSWHQANLTGTIDGNNTVFTFSGVKPAQYSERVFLNYVEQNPVNGDYTINYDTQTVTYAVAPDASLSATPHLIRYHA